MNSVVLLTGIIECISILLQLHTRNRSITPISLVRWVQVDSLRVQLRGFGEIMICRSED